MPRRVSLFALLRAVPRLGVAAVGHDAASPHRRRQAVCRLRRRHGARDRRLDPNLIEILNRAGECGIARVLAGYIRAIGPITARLTRRLETAEIRLNLECRFRLDLPQKEVQFTSPFRGSFAPELAL